MYPSYWWHMGWMALFWIAVIVVIVLLARASAASGRGGEPRDTPEEILKRRYAKGEIDKDEYERKLTDLRR